MAHQRIKTRIARALGQRSGRSSSNGFNRSNGSNSTRSLGDGFGDALGESVDHAAGRVVFVNQLPYKGERAITTLD